MSDLAIRWQDEAWFLLPEAALYWPAQSMLLIADAHFGKAASFRALGQPVPHGTTADNLRRLDAMLARHPAQRLVFLGDFLHSRQGRAPATLDALADWRARHAALRVTLVRGNHDRHAGDPPAALDIEVVSEPLCVSGIALRHELLPAAGAPLHQYRKEDGKLGNERDAEQTGIAQIAGHLHPAVRLQGPGRDHLRLPCFWFSEGRAVLPAFGAFTGTALITPAIGDRIYALGADRVWPAPSVAPRAP